MVYVNCHILLQCIYVHALKFDLHVWEQICMYYITVFLLPLHRGLPYSSPSRVWHTDIQTDRQTDKINEKKATLPTIPPSSINSYNSPKNHTDILNRLTHKTVTDRQTFGQTNEGTDWQKDTVRAHRLSGRQTYGQTAEKSYMCVKPAYVGDTNLSHLNITVSYSYILSLTTGM